eukprot:TRINITY_DN3064_c0_g1_i1.p1 TRINITY_DN3064_c0_g1~~TRINITY_DN3064_c0_g1_i1.p1  ORF type:complete len:291 (+),score=49.68 TRINITY_DN3064_c0_g1_i1:283-1155(+)
MSLTGPSPFQNAPLTKVITVISGSATFFSVFLEIKNYFDLPHLSLLTTKGQLWRIFSVNLPFTYFGEAMCGFILLYQFRLFERQMGSRKYAVFLLWTLGIASLVQLGFLTLTNIKLPTGPYSLIFSLLVQFLYDVPATQNFRFCGLPLSNKFLTYMLSAQLGLSNYPSSLVGVVSGLLAGSLYRADIFPVRKWLIPKKISEFCTKWMKPLIDPAPTRRRVLFNRPTAAGGFPNMQVPPPFVVQGGNIPQQFDENTIATLMDMGFDRQSVITALVTCGNDVQQATNLLLDM